MDSGLRSLKHSHPRNFNKRVVLDQIRFAHEGISRADLARRMNISRAAVSGIVNDLMAMDLLKEARPLTSGVGRRPMLLEINPDRGYVLGIDLGVTHFEILLANFSADVISALRLPLDVGVGPQRGLVRVVAAVSELLDTSQVTLQDVHAVCVGVPGLVISQAGFLRQSSLMPGWEGFPIQEFFQNIWQIPVSLNNGADLGVLGEWAYGAAQDEHNVAYIKIGSGIGAGLLLDGKIYAGQNGAAGEIGHMSVVDHGPCCACGNIGCLETVASGTAIARQAMRAINSGQPTKLIDYLNDHRISAREVAQAAAAGDQVAREIIRQAGNYIGQAVANLVNLINPGLVVIGGGVTQIGDLLLDPIRQSVQQRCLSASAESVRIVTAGLEPRSTSMGAVARALDIALHLIMEA